MWGHEAIAAENRELAIPLSFVEEESEPGSAPEPSGNVVRIAVLEGLQAGDTFSVEIPAERDPAGVGFALEATVPVDAQGGDVISVSVGDRVLPWAPDVLGAPAVNQEKKKKKKTKRKAVPLGEEGKRNARFDKKFRTLTRNVLVRRQALSLDQILPYALAARSRAPDPGSRARRSSTDRRVSGSSSC